MTAKVGLLVGRERSFPNALIEEINRRDVGVSAEYLRVGAVRMDRPPPYQVIIDRISHDVPGYQPILKLAALAGCRVINNPFWRIADDKFFNAALASTRLGVRVPKTYVLPAKSYIADVTSDSLTNLELVDWKAIADDLGFPMFLKPHWGGGWRDVTRVNSLQELLAAYDRSGQKTMIVQEAIQWTQYVRCIVIGREDVLAAPWDPRLSHFERYTGAAKSMEPLTPIMLEKVHRDAKKLCVGLGYDMNTVELAISGNDAYAIDFMNSAPDFDISSLGQEHFRWTVEKMADLAIRYAKNEGQPPRRRFDDFLRS
ncbi:MAG: RimK family alpha-L-glutamate ligase [Myxococcales bacterium]